jgi:hypothetical protein
MKILHCFADTGAENPCLSRHGDIVRLGLDVTPNQYGNGIQADARMPPFKEAAQFDLGVFHPPCGGVSPMSDTGSGDRSDWPDLVPEARELAQTYCDHWIIENKPRDSLDATVVLDGHMFNLDIEYKRAFECSFDVEQPPQQQQLAETSPFYYSEMPAGWWASVKGSSTEFSKGHLAKNTIPAAYLDYLLRYYYKAVEDETLPDYTDYNERMEKKRRQAANSSLKAFQEL